MVIFGLTVWELLLIFAASGIVSFGVTQLFKLMLASYLQHTPQNDKQPWWWNVLLRVFAILLGTAVGAVFSMIGTNIVVSAIVGFCGGILNTVIVFSVKEKIKNAKIQNKDENEEGVVE